MPRDGGSAGLSLLQTRSNHGRIRRFVPVPSRDCELSFRSQPCAMNRLSHTLFSTVVDALAVFIGALGPHGIRCGRNYPDARRRRDQSLPL